MSITTTMTVAGSAFDPVANNLFPSRLVIYSKGGIPTLTLLSPGAALPGLPDPYLGKLVTLSVNGTLVFSGVVASCSPTPDDRLGWVLQYQCQGLRSLGDRVPFTDDNTGIDSAGFNLQPDDPAYFASRAGRSLGQILTAVLTMKGNATALNGQGLGQYTGLPSAPALPSATVTDLAALTLIPQGPIYVAGEKCLNAIEGLLEQWAPNYCLWIQPDGTLRFLDLRTFTPNTLTADVDPIDRSPLARDWSDCFPRVLVRGQPLVEAAFATVSNGLLAPDFSVTGWTDADFQQAQTSQDDGSCTCTSTTSVVITSAHAATHWIANFWDQTSSGRKGWVYLWDTTLGGSVNQFLSRRMVACTALSPGGTCTLTLDRPLPATGYNHYQIFGETGPESLVYRLYQVTNAGIAGAMTTAFNAPVPFVLAGQDGATLTSVPLGSVLWSNPGTTAPPYSESMLDFTVDPVAGTILFSRPTWEVAGKTPPADVRALLAVNVGVNQAVYPPDVSGSPVFSGTSYSAEGRQDTLVVTVSAWRDPVNQANMDAYAQDLWDSVRDTIVEGGVTYYGLYTPALAMGAALTVAGPSGSPTGWEGLSLPILECELEWDESGGSDMITRMHCSNRRAHLSAEAFLKPDRTGVALGGEPFGYEGAFGSGFQDGFNQTAHDAFDSAASRSFGAPTSDQASGEGPGGQDGSDPFEGGDFGFGGEDDAPQTRARKKKSPTLRASEGYDPGNAVERLPKEVRGRIADQDQDTADRSAAAGTRVQDQRVADNDRLPARQQAAAERIARQTERDQQEQAQRAPLRQDADARIQEENRIAGTRENQAQERVAARRAAEAADARAQQSREDD